MKQTSGRVRAITLTLCVARTATGATGVIKTGQIFIVMSERIATTRVTDPAVRKSLKLDVKQGKKSG